MGATATTPIRPKREMVESKAPEQFQFTKQGQTLAGILISIEPTVVKEKQALEYMLVDERRERVTFLGTNDLDKKIVPGHIGHWLEIRYERDDASFQKQGQNPMKVFKVLVSKEKESGF
jgi:hypothetical protein